MQLQLVTAAVKLFLKSPQPRAQQMIQLVLTYATQVGSCKTVTDQHLFRRAEPESEAIYVLKVLTPE